MSFKESLKESQYQSWFKFSHQEELNFSFICMQPCLTPAVVERAYRKNSKNWDTLNYYRDCPTNGIVGFYSAILRSKDADRITNRVDTDQTAP